MKIRFWNLLLLGSLMSVVADDKKAGGGGGSADESAEEPEKPAEQAPEASAVVPTVFDRAKVLGKSKPTLQAELRTLQGSNTKLTADLAAANQTIRTQGEELTRLRQLETDLTATVEELENGKQSVAAAAADLAAQAGIPPENMPKQEEQGSDFASLHAAAVKAGPKALGAFMRDNKAEVREQLRKQA